MAPKILIVLTSFDKIEANNHPTGWFLVRPHPQISKIKYN